MNKLALPVEFGIFPFTGAFTAEEFKTFFAWCARHAVSDVDLVGGSPVSVSRYGRRERCSSTVLPNTLLGNMLDELLGREIRPRVQSGKPSDRPIQIDGDMHGRYGLGRGERVRLRSHIIQGTSAREEKAVSVTMRVIPSAIPDFMSMGIEPDLAAAMLPKNGLGFVCGETGSGKSTLLAALYRYCQDTHSDRKIVTYEDPVEYILGKTEDLLPPHQAQIGRDVSSFAEGLRSAMRRNPELIGIGEIRDTETAEAAVQAGQTGHLCIGTMHTRSPGETIPRILGLFNSQIRDAMAWALLGVLRFIVIQVLVKTTDGKRRALREYIVFTDDLCSKLQEMPPEKWGRFLDSILYTEKRRIVDQVREMYIRHEIDRSEAMLYLPIKELTA
ncbi:plasmid transfer ATPase TraJ [Pectobacterium atrosepticum]|uniref:plasmid transfer ATPase TraJ n=1 Tax=Pectobacterium atrosepticum TaxID=29471 RepID=UPI003019FEFD